MVFHRGVLTRINRADDAHGQSAVMADGGEISFVLWLGQPVAASAECLRELGLEEGEAVNGATLQTILARPLGGTKPADSDDDAASAAET